MGNNGPAGIILDLYRIVWNASINFRGDLVVLIVKRRLVRKWDLPSVLHVVHIRTVIQ